MEGESLYGESDTVEERICIVQMGVNGSLWGKGVYYRWGVCTSRVVEEG